MILPEIPQDQRNAPWIQPFTALLQNQTRVIEDQARAIENQARVIQEQAEQIAALKATVQELRNEITRLKKTPKRPRFRPSGTPSNKSSTKQNNRSHVDMAKPPKAKEEIILKPVCVPKGSRFKGYCTYSIQELMLTPKDVNGDMANPRWFDDQGCPSFWSKRLSFWA